MSSKNKEYLWLGIALVLALFFGEIQLQPNESLIVLPFFLWVAFLGLIESLSLCP